MKITITRLLDVAKPLATEAGQQMADFFNYMAEFVELTVRSLRNGLTFADNFDATEKTVSLTHNVAQIVSSPKVARGIVPMRVVSQTTGLDAFAWYYDDTDRLTVKAKFTDAPTDAIEVVLVIFF